jgi:hypothetical protein
VDTYRLLVSVKVDGKTYNEGDTVTEREANAGYPSLLKLAVVSLVDSRIPARRKHKGKPPVRY